MSATEQEAYGVYYAVTKWNYYLQGAEVIVRNDHKPLARFLNGKNANNKVNRWGLEVATYNITFKWILGACNKAADCLSHLVELLQNQPTTINMLSATHPEGPAFNTRSRTTQQHLSKGPTPHTDVTAPVIPETGHAFFNQYLPVLMCPSYMLSDNGTEFMNQLMDKALQQLGIECIFSTPYHPQSNGKLEVFHIYLKPTLKKLCEKDPTNWDKYINQVLASCRVVPNLATAETPFFLVYGRDPTYLYISY